MQSTKKQLATKIRKKKKKKADLNWNTDKTEFPVIWKKESQSGVPDGDYLDLQQWTV